jgi:hypothetical protein
MGGLHTAVLVISSLMHLPHHVHSEHVAEVEKTKHGVRMALKNNRPTMLAAALFAIFKQDRNLRKKQSCNPHRQMFFIDQIFYTFHHKCSAWTWTASNYEGRVGSPWDRLKRDNRGRVDGSTCLHLHKFQDGQNCRLANLDHTNWFLASSLNHSA